MAETEGNEKPTYTNKLLALKDEILTDKAAGVPLKKGKGGNPAWVKGMKAPFNSREAKVQREEKLKQTGKNFPGLARVYMSDKGFKRAEAIAEDKKHPRQLDAIKFLAAYGYGQPAASLTISDGPAELKKSTQEQLENVLRFTKRDETEEGLPAPTEVS